MEMKYMQTLQSCFHLIAGYDSWGLWKNYLVWYNVFCCFEHFTINWINFSLHHCNCPCRWNVLHQYPSKCKTLISLKTFFLHIFWLDIIFVWSNIRTWKWINNLLHRCFMVVQGMHGSTIRGKNLSNTREV